MAQVKDDIQGPLIDLLFDYEKSAGVNTRSAMRDLLTEMMHLCESFATNKMPLDFDEILRDAREVFEQECEK